MVVSDNGTELTSNAMHDWQEKRRVVWPYIAPGKPMQNGLVESFNGRPHSSLDGLTPRDYHQRSEEDQTPNRAN